MNTYKITSSTNSATYQTRQDEIVADIVTIENGSLCFYEFQTQPITAKILTFAMASGQWKSVERRAA
jgi:hypothetical protein